MPLIDSPIQAPLLRGKAEQLDRRRFRKQILPIGRVSHPELDLEFDRETLQELATNFMDRAYDQVPFVLVNDFNEHGADPRRFHGEVVDMTVGDDGLYATFDMTGRGADLIRDNPRLGVSPRLVPEPEPGSSTPRKWPAVEHVAGTFRPRADRMKDWELVDLSVQHAEHRRRSLPVVDLSASSYDLGHIERRDRAAQLAAAWGASLGEAPEPQPVELSNMTTNPAKALADQWEKETYGR